MLTQERLKELLEYNPITGEFTRLKKNSNVQRLGVISSVDERGYIRICIDGKQYRLHRVAFLYVEGSFPEGQVDHINHKKGDNRWCNLRIVNHKTNGRNTGMIRTNTSGITGVRWRKDRSCWTASIGDSDNREHLGHFKDLFSAACARRSAERRLGYHINHGK